MAAHLYRKEVHPGEREDCAHSDCRAKVAAEASIAAFYRAEGCRHLQSEPDRNEMK